MYCKSIHKDAKWFCTGDDKALIHSEWVQGRGVETCLCGDMIGMLYIVSCVIKRICERTGTEFDETLEVVKKIRSGEDATEIQRGEIAKAKDDEEARVREEIEKKYKHKLSALEDENKRMRNEIAADNALIVRLKQKVEATRDAATVSEAEMHREIRKKENEIRKLRSDNEKLQNELLAGGY